MINNKYDLTSFLFITVYNIFVIYLNILMNNTIFCIFVCVSIYLCVFVVLIVLLNLSERIILCGSNKHDKAIVIKDKITELPIKVIISYI